MSETIVNFTLRENSLMTRLQAALARSETKLDTQTYLGERLWNWRFWIQDTQIYLNELKSAVEDAEKKFPSPVCPHCPPNRPDPLRPPNPINGPAAPSAGPAC